MSPGVRSLAFSRISRPPPHQRAHGGLKDSASSDAPCLTRMPGPAGRSQNCRMYDVIEARSDVAVKFGHHAPLLNTGKGGRRQIGAKSAFVKRYCRGYWVCTSYHHDSQENTHISCPQQLAAVLSIATSLCEVLSHRGVFQTSVCESHRGRVGYCTAAHRNNNGKERGVENVRTSNDIWWLSAVLLG